jgi:hypothetical protein
MFGDEIMCDAYVIFVRCVSQGAFPQVPVPQNRLSPLKAAWVELYKTVTGSLKLDMRMNLKTRKACNHTL